MNIHKFIIKYHFLFLSDDLLEYKAMLSYRSLRLSS